MFWDLVRAFLVAGHLNLQASEVSSWDISGLIGVGAWVFLGALPLELTAFGAYSSCTPVLKDVLLIEHHVKLEC